MQAQRLIPLGAWSDATFILSSPADSVLQVHFDVVCLLTFLESKVDRSYLLFLFYCVIYSRQVSIQSAQ